MFLISKKDVSNCKKEYFKLVKKDLLTGPFLMFILI